MNSLRRNVAWYDLKRGSWLNDIFVLLHPPYTAWHLAYIAIGATFAPHLNWAKLAWTVLAYFLAMGIGAHCIDEYKRHPLKTRFSDRSLCIAASVSVAGAVAIGALGILAGEVKTMWILPCIIFGAFIVFAYNLELYHGLFHKNIWFGIAWGSFPFITAYLAQTNTINVPTVILAGACAIYSMAQRKLSTHSRFWRRQVTYVSGQYIVNGESKDGTQHVLLKTNIIKQADIALQYMTWSIILVAIGLLINAFL